MDPTAMRAAMDAMKGMSPQQMQQMMSAMGSVSPDMMQQAQSMASRMSPDDWARAREAMSGMSPDQMAQQAGMAQQQLTAQTQYVLSASQQLKAEGNTLHLRGDYQAAIEKYERAKSNVATHTSKEAAELRKACTLNLSSCYLNLQQWTQCIQQCDEVLDGEPDNLKALYRRGQAHLGAGLLEAAAADLTRAVKLSASDPAQQHLIKDKLQETKDRLGAQRASGAHQATAIGTAEQQHRSAEQTVSPSAPSIAPSSPVATNSSCNSRTMTSALGPTGMPAVTPDMLKATADMMRTNPNWAQEVSAKMQQMSDAQLAQMNQQMGSTITREQLVAEQGRLSGLTAADLEKMAQLQSAVPPEMAARLRANPNDPEALAATTQLLQSNPQLASSAADVISKMSPDQLAAMAKQAGMPAGMHITPEMAKAAALSLQSMSSEDMQQLSQMAAGMSQPSTTTPARTATPAPSSSNSSSAAPATAPAPAGLPAMSPEMAKQAAQMLSSMPPEQLQAMAGAAGMPGMTPEMAKMAAEMMASMPAEQMAQMTAMMGGGGGTPAMPGLTAGAGPSGVAAQSGAPSLDMLSKMDPKMMEQGMQMMRSMDPEAMISMMMASGVKDRAKAEAIVKQMQGMSDSQFKAMAKVAGVAQKGMAAMQKTKRMLASKTLLVVAVLVLVLAILLRAYGVM